jgi:hypothetical protein
VRPATPVPPWGSSARRAGRGVRAPATRWPPITWSPTNSSGTAEHGDQQVLKRELIARRVDPDGRVLWKRDGTSCRMLTERAVSGTDQ